MFKSKFEIIKTLILFDNFHDNNPIIIGSLSNLFITFSIIIHADSKFCFFSLLVLRQTVRKVNQHEEKRFGLQGFLD